MLPSNLQCLLSIAWCVVLPAAPLAACSADEPDEAGDGGLDPAPISIQECDAQGGFPVFDPNETSSPETTTRCPARTDLIAPIYDIDIFALCCFVEYERCKPQRVQVGSTCDTEIAYYWLGSGCAPIRDCACSGPDCGEGYATDAECTAAYESCEFGLLRCGSLPPGNTCPTAKYCSEPGCTATSHGGLCVPRRTACEDSLEPVCGCDGVTYDNDCELAKASTSLRSFGACEAPAEP